MVIEERVEQLEQQFESLSELLEVLYERITQSEKIFDARIKQLIGGREWERKEEQ